VTFEEAVRLCRAVMDTADWALIERQVSEEDGQAPLLRLRQTYERIMEEAR
jgi:hypothetical protein